MSNPLASPAPSQAPAGEEITQAVEYLEARAELYQRQAVNQTLNGNLKDAAAWEEEATALRTVLAALQSQTARADGRKRGTARRSSASRVHGATSTATRPRRCRKL